MSNQIPVAIILSKPSSAGKGYVTRSKRIRGTGHRTKFPQNVHLFDISVIFRLFFFSLLCFLSVLIFKHKKPKNRSSVIASLIEYDR